MPLAPPQGHLGQPGHFAIQGAASGAWPTQGNPGSAFLYIGSPFSWTYNSAISSASPTIAGFTMPASGGYTVQAGSLPTGISLNANTGALTGTPTLEVYSSSVTIRATDTGAVTHDAVITISVPRAPAISYAGSPFTWSKDSAISTASVTSSGGQVTSYALQSGSLPTGISLNTSTGALTGTPTVEAVSSFVVRATGPGGTGDATVNYTVAVASSLLTDLIAYWNLDEASGNRADSTASALTLTDNNTVTSQATGGPDGARCAQFTAANTEMLTRASGPAIQTGDITWTWSGWVWIDSTGANRGIACKGSSITGGFEWWLKYDDAVSRFTFRAASTTVTASTFGAPSTGAWAFVVVEHDAAANTVSIQVNDGAVDSLTTGANPGVSNTVAYAIGAADGFGDVYHDGRMAYVGFWKRKLTSGERTSLYNAGAGKAYAAL